MTSSFPGGIESGRSRMTKCRMSLVSLARRSTGGATSRSSGCGAKGCTDRASPYSRAATRVGATAESVGLSHAGAWKWMTKV